MRCPHALYGEHARTFLEMWNEWKLFGVLPFPGALGDQPGAIYEGLKFVELISREQEARIDKKQRDAARR